LPKEIKIGDDDELSKVVEPDDCVKTSRVCLSKSFSEDHCSENLQLV